MELVGEERNPETLPGRILATGTAILAIVLSLWVIYYGFEAPFDRRQHANIVLGLGLAVYYVGRSATVLENGLDTVRDKATVAGSLALALVVLAATAYVHVSYFRWLESGRALVYSDLDLLVGAALIVAVVDATYRKYGTALGVVILVTLGYAYFGALIPGILGHSGMTLEQIVRRQTITLTGIYGFLLQIGATWIAIFIIFAGMVKGHDGFDYLLAIGERARYKFRSGVAQTAVLTSMVMGTMMGSSASNVATTGSFTIPLMKEQGIPSRDAAAIEAVASTGGQILPPIMGTAAFLMADIIGVQFSVIAIAGIIPALLFYLSVAASIHFLVLQNDWVLEAEEPADTDLHFVLRGCQYIIPLGVLIYVLMVLQFDPMTAGLYTIGSLVVTRVLYLTGTKQPIKFIGEIVDGLRRGGENLAPFVAILASLGIVINVFSQTGVAQTIANELLLISGELTIVILLIAMVVSLLLGLGMPTPAAYVLVATILAPAITAQGIDTLVAHFFLFYFALLSAITPPIALAVAIAIGISGSDFLQTAKQALVLGGPAFLIPYIFVANPSIIQTELPRSIGVMLVLAVAMIATVVSFTGTNGARRLTHVERGISLALLLGIAFGPSIVVQAGAATIFGILLAYTYNIGPLSEKIGPSRLAGDD